MARAEVVEGEYLPLADDGSAGRGPRRPAPGEVTARRRSGRLTRSDGSRRGSRGAVRGGAGVACWGREGASGVGGCQARG
jgi:hypothetical protein